MRGAEWRGRSVCLLPVACRSLTTGHRRRTPQLAPTGDNPQPPLQNILRVDAGTLVTGQVGFSEFGGSVL